MFYGQKRSDQIDSQNLLPNLWRRVEKTAPHAAGDAGVGEEDMQLAVGIDSLSDGARNIGFVAGIAGDGYGLAASVLHRACNVVNPLGPVE